MLTNVTVRTKGTVASFLFAILLTKSFGQPSLRTLQSYMTEIRTNTTLPVTQSILNDQRNESQLIITLTPYFSDSLNIVRSKAYYITKRIGQKSTNAAVRTSVITQLIRAIRDKDTGISGNASEALTAFRKSEFTQAHKDSIGNLIHLKTPHLDQILKLAGYLEMTNQQAKITSIINSTTTFKNKWAARLALARMGDQVAITYINTKIANAPVNDDMVYDVVPDLVYTRQKEIFKYLEQLINSDETNCQSANPDANQKILCGYRVMEYIAPAIQSFPLKVDDTGDLDIDDYSAALLTVRTWLRQNPGYVIISETF
jgi:hypothetical protein